MPRSLPRALLVEARPKQWVKNLLVFAAPIAAGAVALPSIGRAQAVANEAARRIRFEGAFFRRDIGHRVLGKSVGPKGPGTAVSVGAYIFTVLRINKRVNEAMPAVMARVTELGVACPPMRTTYYLGRERLIPTVKKGERHALARCMGQLVVLDMNAPEHQPR